MAVITAKQYETAASLLKCEVAAIQAVAGVESNGAGFLSDGRIKILFEPHIFFRELRTLKIDFLSFSKKNPDLVYERQGQLPYGTYNQQWEKLNRAKVLHEDAALKSCSWGKFQPLGKYNYELGFDSVKAMVKRFEIDEYEHLMGFVRMIKYRKLDIHLRNKNWAAFSYAYNGAGYLGRPGKQDDYDYKIEQLYKKLVK